MVSEAWDYQIRITLDDAYAPMARRDPDDPALAPLAAVLRAHDAQLKCQFDAFAGYVAEAEAPRRRQPGNAAADDEHTHLLP